MKYLPKLHQLKVFQEVIHYGSIRAAARAMNQSQPALTRNIRELEQLLGTALMTRGTRGVELTEPGRMFAVRMQLIMEELQRATDEIKQVNQQTQSNLSIGFSSLIALSIFPQTAEQFKKHHPKTTLRIKEAQLSALLPALWEGRLDFAIGTISSEVPLSDFIEEPLFKARFGIICRKGHPRMNCSSLEQLYDAKWYLPETDMGYYKQINFILTHYIENVSSALFSAIRLFVV
ncbi:LysR family transcriptional regulator [Budvicia aquatica]|uniref:HTH-type transcriptional regulator AbgR n=1 Tax=Budvicia aquatica TaxID=82979 RepID=A0A484ZCI6_9GAMM|nr:LysR family transcriptional regulator [Budvicia aquatica]VFS46104.1 HTH-type transcriptional regulator AbgR [Budvicia aquatica]